MKHLIVLVLAGLVSLQVATAADSIDSNDRLRVMESVVEHLEQDYVDPQIGKTAAQGLRNAMSLGDFQRLQDPQQFATALSSRLQALTGDRHLNVEYSPEPIGADARGPQKYSDEQMQRWYGAHINYGVQRVERLEGNIGYLDLRVFPPLELGGHTIVAALNLLADLDGLVIDLRENGGGIGDTADLVASYLFDGSRQPLTGVYDRPTDTLTQRFTLQYVPGKRFGDDKPVYVLISGKTFSAAEALAYNLQALGRAKIIGEVSGGGAHPFDYLPVHEHFVLWSVTARSVNPITGTNWQSVGVQPDIPVPAGEALGVAMEHFHLRQAGRAP